MEIENKYYKSKVSNVQKYPLFKFIKLTIKYIPAEYIYRYNVYTYKPFL